MNFRNFFLFTIIVLMLIIGYRYIQKLTLDKLALKIGKLLDAHRIVYDIDARSMDQTVSTTALPASGADGFSNQIRKFISKQKPISMLLVGFPFKSANHEKKTIGHLPDMAERKSFAYLQAVLNDIKAVYKPGAHITIFCDGIEFAQFFSIPFKHVIDYEKTIIALAQDLPDITFYTSADFISNHKLKDLESINSFIDRYSPTDAEFKKSVSPTALEIAIKRFALEFDHQAGRALLQNQSLDDIVLGLLAREARLRTFISETFPVAEYIRLTMHFSGDLNKKFGIKVSPDSCITPYHGVLVQEKDGSWNIQFKKDVNLEHYELTTQVINTINCPYFKSKY